MQTSKRTVSLKNVARIVVSLCLVFLLASAALYQYALSTVGPGEQSEQWYSPEMEATYLVGPFNTTYFFAKNHTGYGLSAYEGYELLSTNDTDLIQYCVNVTSTDGGKVFVKPGSYAASVTLKNKVRLVLDKGAATVTVTINASATAVLEDWNAGRVRYWKAAVLVWDSNLDAGSLTTLSAVLSGALNVTTIYVSTVDALVSTTGTKILKLIVQNGTTFPTSPVDKQVFYRSDEGYLYVYNNSLWKQVGTTLYSNLTGTPNLTTLVYVNGTNALTGSWNVGGSYGIYGATWVNATNLGFTTLYKNGVQVGLVQPATFIIDVSGLTYRAWHGANSTLFDSGTNASAVINNAIGNTTLGTVFVKAGTYSITNTIHLKGQVYVHGEGMYSTIFLLAGSSNCNVFDWTPAGTEQFAGLLDLQINGNKASNTAGKGVYFLGQTWDFKCDHVWILATKEQGFHVATTMWGHKYNDLIIETATLAGFQSAGAGPASFVGCRFGSNGAYGFYDASADLTFVNCEFDSNTDDGLQFESGGYGLSIVGGRIAYNGGDGLDIRGNYARVEGVYIKESTGAGVRVAGTNNMFLGNSFYNNGAGTVVNTGGVTNKIRNNVGFVTENSGTWTGSNPVTVAHGCAGTPTVVNIDVNAAQPYSTGWTANATYIVIYHNGLDSLTGSWSVEYKP